jgi:hypothetical protein
MPLLPETALHLRFAYSSGRWSENRIGKIPRNDRPNIQRYGKLAASEMNRHELLRQLALVEIADDYEEPSHVFDNLEQRARAAGLRITRLETYGLRTQLTEEGLAIAKSLLHSVWFLVCFLEFHEGVSRATFRA